LSLEANNDKLNGKQSLFERIKAGCLGGNAEICEFIHEIDYQNIRVSTHARPEVAKGAYLNLNAAITL